MLHDGEGYTGWITCIDTRAKKEAQGVSGKRCWNLILMFTCTFNVSPCTELSLSSFSSGLIKTVLLRRWFCTAMRYRRQEEAAFNINEHHSYYCLNASIRKNSTEKGGGLFLKHEGREQPGKGSREMLNHPPARLAIPREARHCAIAHNNRPPCPPSPTGCQVRSGNPRLASKGGAPALKKMSRNKRGSDRVEEEEEGKLAGKG